MDLLIAMSIISLAVVGITQLFVSGTQNTSVATQMTVAARLVQNVHEYAMTLPHKPPGNGAKSLFDLENTVFDPIVDSSGNAVLNLSGSSLFPGWKQRVTVSGADMLDLSTDVPLVQSAGGPKRLTVTVTYRDKPVITEQWILAPTPSF